MLERLTRVYIIKNAVALKYITNKKPNKLLSQKEIAQAYREVQPFLFMTCSTQVKHDKYLSTLVYLEKENLICGEKTKQNMILTPT